MPVIQGFESLKNLPEEMKAGAHAAAHHHPNEQAFRVTAGKMDIRIGDVFAPRREDFLTAEAPAYMRKG